MLIEHLPCGGAAPQMHGCCSRPRSLAKGSRCALRSADACGERESGIRGHPGVPGKGTLTSSPVLSVRDCSIVAHWRAHVDTKRKALAAFASCRVSSELGGCVEMAVHLPPALQAAGEVRQGRGGPEPRLGSAEQASWLGRHPLGKGGCSRFQSAFCSSPGAAYSGRAYAGNSSGQR